MTGAELLKALQGVQGFAGDVGAAITARGLDLSADMSVVVDVTALAAAIDPPLALVEVAAETFDVLLTLIEAKTIVGDAPYASSGEDGGGPGEYRGR